MEKLKFLLVTMVLLTVLGCVDAASRETTPRSNTSGIPHYQGVINSWTGKLVSSIITHWGPPDKTLNIAGKEYIVYEKWTDETFVTPGSSGYYNHGLGGRASSSYVKSVLECTYTFEIRRGIIVGGNVTGANKNSKWCADGS